MDRFAWETCGSCPRQHCEETTYERVTNTDRRHPINWTVVDGILRRGFQLGDRRIYPLTGEIRGPGGTSHIQPKVMEVLLCLAQQQGDVLERARIVEQVWGDTAVSDEVLTRCISDLRHHLGDDNISTRFIQTVPKRGYRLLMPIHALGAPDAPRVSEKAPVDEPSAFATLINNLRRRRVFRVVGAYAIAVWLALQIADTVFPPLGVPNWAMTLTVWVAVMGFPVVAILAWTLQVTEKGIVVHNSLVPTESLLAYAPGRAIDFVIIGILGLIVSFLIYERVVDERQPLVIMTERGEITLPALEPNVVNRNSIAVLPFENLSSDSRMDYLAMGLAEEVLNLLAKIRELTVPSKNSSFAYQGKDFDLDSIAKLLRVRNVLEGNIQGQVEDLSISAQLTDAESGSHIWSQTFARRNMDVLAVRDDIARAVVDSLKIALSLESQNRILRRPTESADAYDYYLQALGYLRRPRSEQTLDNAEALFHRALDLDPNYALAYAGLCNVYLGKYRLDRRTVHVDPAERACGNALSIDPDLSEVHVALGSLYRHTGQHDLAELEFQRAIVMNPKLEPAYYGLAMTYKAQDRLNEAESIFRYAVNLEPGYWGTHLALGNYYLQFGKPDKAVSYFQRVTELNPEYALGYNNLGAALYNSGNLKGGEAAYLKSLEMQPSEIALRNMGSVYYNTGRFESAVEMFRQAVEITPHDYRNWGRLAFAKRFIPALQIEAPRDFQTAIDLVTDALEINPKDWWALAYLASYRANTGDIDGAQTALDQALAYGPNDPHVHYFGAITHIALGDSERAIQFLQTAAELGYSADAISSDPDFAGIKNDRRLEALLAVAKKQHE